MAGCSLDGLAVEWEATPEIRNSLREGKPLIHEVSEKQVDIQLPSKFSMLIRPILVRMNEANKKMPGVDALRVEIKSVLDLTKRLSNDEGEIDKYSWLIRKQLSFIKAKCRRREVSTAVDDDEDAYDDDDTLEEGEEPADPSSSAGTGGSAGDAEDVNAEAGGAGCEDLHNLMNEFNDFHCHVSSAASAGADTRPSEEPIFPSGTIVVDDEADDLAAPGCSQDDGVSAAVVLETNGPTELGSAVVAEAAGSGTEAKASDEEAGKKPGVSERALKLARLAELKQRIEQFLPWLKGQKQACRSAGSVSTEGPSEVSAGIASVPGSTGLVVLDDQETLPHNIFEAESPPPSSEPPSSKRKETSEVTAAELREDYQLRQCKTKKMKSPGSAKGARLPYNPYSPEVLDAKAKGSKDPFTPDEKVTTSDVGRVDQLAVRAAKKAEDKRGAKKKGGGDKNESNKNKKPEGEFEDTWGGYTAEEWEHWLDYGDDDGGHWDGDAEPEPAAPVKGKKRKAESSLEDDDSKPKKAGRPKAKAKAKASPKAKGKAKAKASAKKDAKALAKAAEPEPVEPEDHDGDEDAEKVSTFARRYRPEKRQMAMAKFDAIREAFMTIVRPKLKSTCPSSFEEIGNNRAGEFGLSPFKRVVVRIIVCVSEDPFWTHCVAEFKKWNIDIDTVQAACETAAESFVKKISKEKKNK
ncbi:ANK3 [Symbiodinium sp. CCMP2456]|nr:ANK3 [Symbiodinium sp. CCMP2456]